MDAPPETPARALAAIRRSTVRMVVFVAVMAGAVALMQWPPVRSVVADAPCWRARVEAAGVWAPAVFFVLSAALVALGAPRLPLAGLAGALFGFWVGGLVAWLSAAVGAYATFLFARWGARDWVRRRLRLPEAARALLLHPDVWAIVILRQMPIIAFVQNAALGLTEARHRVFLLGTLLGTLPSTIVVALVGGSVTRESWQGAVGQLGAAMAILALIGLAGARWRRGRRAAATPRASA